MQLIVEGVGNGVTLEALGGISTRAPAIHSLGRTVERVQKDTHWPTVKSNV